MFWAFVVAIGVWAALSRVRGRLTQVEDTIAEQARTLEALERRLRLVTDAKKELRPPVPAAAVPPIPATPPIILTPSPVVEPSSVTASAPVEPAPPGTPPPP